MTPFVERCEPASPYFARLVSATGLSVAGLTRDQAEQLRDDLTNALRANQQPSSTYLLACRLYDEALAMGDAAA